MKIGFIIYGTLDTLSGGYLYDRKLVEYLRARGDTVELVSLPWRNYSAHLTDNFRFRLPNHLDILIQDELNHPSLIFANRGKHPYPVISLVHHLRSSEFRPGWQNAFYRIVEKKYLTSVDGFIFNSKTTKRVVQQLLSHGKPAVVAYPPTDRFGGPIPKPDILERAGIGEFKILFLGNLIYRKGLHTLLEAIQQLKRLSEFQGGFHVDVVGSLTAEPVYVKLIQEIIKTNGLFSCVTLHDSLDQEPLIDKLRSAHVLVVPSSYEGFGIVYLEGMCFGLPAIGTTTGAAGEIIEPGKTGYLIDPEDSKSLAEHLRTLAENRNLLIHLSLNARERYLRQPPWTESGKSIRDFLFSLVQ